MRIMNQKVEHKRYGIGTIFALKGKKVYVAFGKLYGDMAFPYPKHKGGCGKSAAAEGCIQRNASYCWKGGFGRQNQDRTCVMSGTMLLGSSFLHVRIFYLKSIDSYVT